LYAAGCVKRSLLVLIISLLVVIIIYLGLLVLMAGGMLSIAGCMLQVAASVSRSLLVLTYGSFLGLI
jgi:hypothetical protein